MGNSYGIDYMSGKMANCVQYDSSGLAVCGDRMHNRQRIGGLAEVAYYNADAGTVVGTPSLEFSPAMSVLEQQVLRFPS